ncbi:LOW QUALITY PROTEIN: uncharacterized protein [Eurosta solidaginis]|uniref:LOW QUALITY PROTEIN: uncharacterized protein n=1 Tax=Eurosta solidaginis TaxID=178769 RepID=UPI0035312ED7
MGRSSLKFLETPNNALQELQLEKRKREQRERKQEKQQRKIAKLQKKQAKKTKAQRTKMSQNTEKQTSINFNRISGGGAAVQRTSCLNSQSTSYEINREEFNRQIEQQTQNHSDFDLCTFVMNQVSLAVQFFGNYENELTLISEELLAKENELNQNLEEHSVLISTPLNAAISKWIQFKPIHGPNKHNPQPFQPLTIYVIFENIDIARPNDANYDSISPLCKVDLDTEFYKTTPTKEEHIEMLRETKWKGYVRLKLREEPKLQRTTASANEVYTDGSSGYSTASCHSFKQGSRITNNYNTDTEYEYAYITLLNGTHRPLSELKLQSIRCPHSMLDVKVLPDRCISTLAQYVEPTIAEDTDGEDTSEDDNDEESFSDNMDSDDSTEEFYKRAKPRYRDYETVLQAIRAHKQELERQKILLQQRFLNSKEFMHYFGELVRLQLADRLQLTYEELAEATYSGASVHTKYCEFIPAILEPHNAQHWPECAFQFRIRERPISTNPLTGQQFQWPTRSMIRRIESFGYHVIPIGYVPKGQRNPFRELEWRIVFPKAERYLEQRLTSTQVKVFMMTKALVKTFVEPQEKQHKSLMFTMDHLRMHLFWECERNFTGWPEEYLGEIQLRFISSFMQHLREKCLKDFFIEERNLFECVPEYSLVMLFSIFADDIAANPLMHLMVALRNIDPEEDFFPKLNYKKLYENLSENNLLRLKLRAKNSHNLIGLGEVQDETMLTQDEGAAGLVGMNQHRERIKGRLRRKTHVMRHTIEMKRKQEMERRHLSEESTDVEFFFRHNLKNSPLGQINQGVENLQRTNVLELFIDYLIVMAEKALEFRALHLTKTFLAQARRLSKFYNNYGCDMGAKEYFSTIESIEEELDAVQINGDATNYPPTLPIRTSIECVKTKPAKELIEHSESGRRLVKVDVEAICSEKANTKPMIRRKIESKALTQSLNNLLLFTRTQKSINSSDHDAIRSSNRLRSYNLTFSAEVTDISEAVDDTQICQTSLESCEDDKSVKEYHFDDNVIAIPVEDDDEDDETYADDGNNEVCQGANIATSGERKHISTARSGLLFNLKFSKSQMLKDFKSSTEKLLTTVSSEERRLQIMDMVKRKTVQVKGALNQCSET